MRAVLAVDDDTTYLNQYRNALHQNYSITTYTNPQNALEYLRNNPIDLLIAEHFMPGIGSFELILKAHEINPRMKVIMSTLAPKGDIDNILEALRGKIIDVAYIQKPFNNAELIRVVQSLIGT